MEIKKKRIIEIETYLNRLANDKKYRIVCDAAKLSEELIVKAGFDVPLEIGDTILPLANGSITKYNAHGKWQVLRDLPKESRYIATIEWSWEQYSGKDQTETITENKDIYRDCYKRNLIPPPSVEISVIKNGNQVLLTSPAFDVIPLHYVSIQHAINLFLELFESCQIVSDDFTPLSLAKINRLNWKMLPPGKYPWEQLNNHLKLTLNKRHPRYSNVIYGRQKFIESFKPEEIWLGTGGFTEYVAYVFSSQSTVILESIQIHNATYIFDQNWKAVSKLTKAEILKTGVHKKRVIHTNGWEKGISDMLL